MSFKDYIKQLSEINDVKDNNIEYYESADYIDEGPSWVGTLEEYLFINNKEEHGGPMTQMKIDDITSSLEAKGFAFVGGGARGLGLIKLANVPYPKEALRSK